MKKSMSTILAIVILFIIVAFIFYQKSGQEGNKGELEEEAEKQEETKGPVEKLDVCSDAIKVIEGYWASPEIVKLEKEKLRMYYNCEGTEEECLFLDKGIHSSISYDGKKWIKESGRRLDEGKQPCVLDKGDKKLRLYYAKEDKSAIVLVASYDGVRFDYKEIIIEKGEAGSLDDAGISAPTIINLDNGYRMYYVGHKSDGDSILSAFSSDGITWTKETGKRIDGTAEPFTKLSGPYAVKDNDKFTLYFSSSAGIYRAYSIDGLTFNTEEIELILKTEDEDADRIPSDPCVIKTEDKHIVYYNIYSEGIYKIECNGKSETLLTGFVTIWKKLKGFTGAVIHKIQDLKYVK